MQEMNVDLFQDEYDDYYSNLLDRIEKFRPIKDDFIEDWIKDSYYVVVNCMYPKDSSNYLLVESPYWTLNNEKNYAVYVPFKYKGHKIIVEGI